MAGYVLKRFIAALPVIFLTTAIVFVLMRLLPGDPVLMLIGDAQGNVSDETIALMRQQQGIDQPIYAQYIAWMGKILTGEFGRSILSRQPVWEILRPRILPTAQIGLMSWLLAILISVPVGIAGATAQNSWKDMLGTVLSLVGAAMPFFLTGGLLIYVVALKWRLLPASGYTSPFADPWMSLKTTILPALTLTIWLSASVTRQARSSFIDVLRHAYIKTARAKGLSENRVIFDHALRNAMLPVVTILGIQLSSLFSGTVITETIFAVPGIGRLLVDSILSRDYPVVQAVVLFLALTVVMANLMVDIAYGLLDPRTREA